VKYAISTLAEWTSVLHLASTWGFESIRALAIRELRPLASAVDRIVLGRRYGIDDWLPDALTALCQRAAPLSAEEAEHMSKEDILRIFQAREQARSSSTPVDEKLAKEAVSQRFALRNDTPVVRKVSPTSSAVRLTLSDVLNICSDNKTTAPDEDDIKKLSAYVAGTDLNEVSLRQIMSKVVRGVPKQWESRYKLCCALRSNLNASIASSCKRKRTGRALFDHILQEQCQVLLRSSDFVESTGSTGGSPPSQLEVAHFIAQVAEEGWVGEETLRVCREHLEVLNDYPSCVTRLCSILNILGKALDQAAYNSGRNAFDEDVFSRLQRLLNNQSYAEAHKDIYVCIQPYTNRYSTSSL
jgi:hypothetical protein